MDALKEAVVAQDAGGLALVRSSGPTAAATLRELLRHPEAGVRALAILCLLEARVPEAVEACREAALDANPQVRATAVRGLSLLLEPARAALLLELYDRATDPETRRQLALAYGRVDKADPSALRKRREAEREPAALEGLAVAGARLGDKDAQAEFGRLLQAAGDPDGRRRFLEYAELLRAPWLLKALLPVLDDLTPLFRTGADGRAELPEHLRACDAAATLAAAVSGRKFSFAVGRAAAYPPAAIDEVRRALQSMA